MSVARRRTKHEELTRTLRDLAAALSPGDRFPSQTELMQTYQVSDRTVLRSLDDLSRAGWIVRRRGSGTFVTEQRCPEPEIAADSSTIAALTLTCRLSRFYQHCMDLLSVLVEEAGWSLVAQHARDENGYEDTLPLEALNPRGFIALHYSLHPIARRLHERGHRTVIVGSPPVDAYPDVPCVTGDHELGGYLVARHLLELGHHRIAYARLNARLSLMQTFRWMGHQRALRQAEREGIRPESPVLDEDVLQSWQEDPTRARRFFQQAGAPTAVVAWNDSEAEFLLRICQAASVRIPEDVSLIGYDALPGGEHFLPPLSSVDQQLPAQLRYALDLVSRRDAPPAAQTVVIVPTLVRRASCGPPRPS